MTPFEVTLILMAVLAALSSITAKLRIPYPILLVVAGLIIGFIPNIPDIKIPPDLIFLIFLPPLLYDAAGNISWHEFKKYRRPISTLSIWLVFFTTTAVAVVAHYCIPGFSWPLAFVLGAIVSPPDAVAATSATKGLGLPKRVLAILEGESLVNDASALIAYRYGVAAVLSGTFVLWQASFQFLLVAGGGIAIGLLIGYIFSRIHTYLLNNPTIETTLTILKPFVSYLLAEHLGFSGVLAVVSTGLFISWRSYEIYSFQTRIQINQFWNILIFLLNGFVFIIIGSQLQIILRDLGNQSLLRLVGYGFLISLVAIVARIVWIFPLGYIRAFLHRISNKTDQTINPSKSELFIISWAGMRGVVSLATGLALPLTMANGESFPQRNVILFITFCVIFVTLVLQGLSLPYLVRRLKVQEPIVEAQKEEKQLRVAIATNSITYIEEELSLQLHERVLNELKENFEHQINYLNGVIRLDESPGKADEQQETLLFREYLEAESRILKNQRESIIRWHKDGTYSEEVIRKIEDELDIRSLSLHAQEQRLINPATLSKPQSQNPEIPTNDKAESL